MKLKIADDDDLGGNGLGVMYRCTDNPNLYNMGSIITNVYPILKTTPKGFWVSTIAGRRWVAAESKNGFAKLTKQAAMEQYFFRKRKQVAILENKLNMAKHFLSLAEAEIEEFDNE